MKRLISLLLILVMMVPALGMGTLAINEHSEYTHLHTEGDAHNCQISDDVVVLREAVCPRCNASAYCLYCAFDYATYEWDSHYRLFYGTCTYKIYYSHTYERCNVCHYQTNLSTETHWCDELHECPLGLYPTCIVSYAA